MLSYTTKTVLRFYGYDWKEKNGVEYYSITCKAPSAFNAIMELKEGWKPWLRFLTRSATITWHSEEEVATENFIKGGLLSWEPQSHPELYRGKTEGVVVVTTENIVVIVTVQRWRG